MEGAHVNDILKNEVTTITRDFSVVLAPGSSSERERLYNQVLNKIIDELGTQSAQEQKLKRTITSSDKLRNSDHILYLLKDAGANSGTGMAIGLLKVGRKTLFLHDLRQQVIEAKPLCILDFYVHKSYQRQGMGKRLFNYMLQDQEVHALQLAIDGPSEPMTKFMLRQYGMKTLLKQSNNFAVAPEFFQEVQHTKHYGIDRRTYLATNPDHQASGSTPTPTVVQPAAAGYGRFSAHQPSSQIGNVIHGGGDQIVRNVHVPEMTETKEGGRIGRLTPEPSTNESIRSSPPRLLPAHTDSARLGYVRVLNDSINSTRGHVDLKYYSTKLWDV